MTDIDRSDEYAEWLAEDARREAAIRNGHHPDDNGPPEPPADDVPDVLPATDEATTWEPIDLGPYLRGEIEPSTPSVGACRTDGQRLLYPGLEHAVIAHTAACKTWFALACVTAEILAGNTVVYLHFEESSPASTIERLQRIGLPGDTIQRLLLFAAPSKRLRIGWLDPLLASRPTLVVIDGVNEAMALLGVKIDLEGWSDVRRQVVVPFKENAAAVLECDHLPLSADPLRGDAYGTVHKGNVIDGARFALVRKEMFGRGRRGVSHLYSTKDRPGYLAAKGTVDDSSAVAYLGTLVVDDSSTGGEDFLTIHAPRPKDNDDAGEARDPDKELRAAILAEIAELPGGRVQSRRRLLTHLRKSGNTATDERVRDALERLVIDDELAEEPGPNRSLGYRLASGLSASDTPDTASPQ